MGLVDGCDGDVMPLAMIGGMTGLALALGVLLIWQGFAAPERPQHFVSRFRRHRRTIARLAIAVAVAVFLTAMTRLVAVGLGAGLVIALWPLAMSVTGRTSKAEAAQMDAIAVWVESLRDSVATSSSVVGALHETTKEPPSALAVPLSNVHARLELRMDVETILRKLANEVDSHLMDHVAGALISHQQEATPGVPEALTSLATSIRQQVRYQGEVAAEQKSYRAQMTAMLVVFGVVAGWICLQPQWLQYYQRPLGQVVVGVAVAMLMAAFVLASRLVRVRRPARFIGEKRGVSWARL